MGINIKSDSAEWYPGGGLIEIFYYKDFSKNKMEQLVLSFSCVC